MELEGRKLGNYILKKCVGIGGMSIVYLADDTRLNREVAVKVIRPDNTPHSHETGNKDSRYISQREASIIMKLEHPHILPLYDYGQENLEDISIAYLVMPYLPEGSLSGWQKKYRNPGVLSPQEVVHFVSQAAQALQYAHNKGVIHRDVKPSNFLIHNTISWQSLPHLLLADFGIAKIVVGENTMSQTFGGTPIYMPPEQWDGTPIPASDQYSLAIMAYEFLTGHLPFSSRPNWQIAHYNEMPKAPSTLNHALNAAVDKVLLRALEKDYRNRFASISAFAEAFKQAINTLPLPPLPPVSPHPPNGESNPSKPGAEGATVLTSQLSNKPCYKNPYMVIVLVALALLVITSSAIWAVNSLIITPRFIDATATAKASTATAKNATNAAIAQISAVSAQATAKVKAEYPYPNGYTHNSPAGGPLLLYDRLDSSSSEWDNVQTHNETCGFQEKYYHVREDTLNQAFLCYNGFKLDKQANNFAVQVNMWIKKGDCGGIAFHNTNTTFIYEVCQDQGNPAYSFIAYSATSQTSYYMNRGEKLIDHQQSNAIISGTCDPDQNRCSYNSMNLNILAIVVYNYNIYFYINSQYVNSSAFQYSPISKLGLIASADLNNDTEAVYNNLLIWTIPT